MKGCCKFCDMKDLANGINASGVVELGSLQTVDEYTRFNRDFRFFWRVKVMIYQSTAKEIMGNH